ncbi:alpha/beta fold hydrolase [Pseudoruegeria sp. HB172150]|uniref:alpha/beta fold hydrolase n=1 Tax=Pseudoruegeria sp. HB172150 TaxID=2721164 RepID=UPI001557235D|nr:alpha/beta hydrolase [Pseudoruegeria sp. HB172150]
MQTFDTFDGVKLAYSDAGAGLPVLCLSGLTRNMSDFDYVAPHLGDVRMICLDYRGRGGSDWADPATYTVPVEAKDALLLLDHLGVEKAAVLGTSRGGLIAMLLAATAKQRLIGACLNDIGPVVAPEGLDVIESYVGKNPKWKTYETAAEAMSKRMAGFDGVPDSRWMEEARKHYVETTEGLKINYDPDLAQIFDAADPEANPAPPDFWPVFDAFAGLPLATIRGANSDLLSPETFAEMKRRRPDMIAAEVPGRGHVPFLDEPEAVAAIREWVGQCKSISG